MPAKIGTSAVAAAFVGANAASRIYLGATEVWPVCAQSALLLAFDGADLDATTTDASQSAHAVTFHGNAIISTAHSKWGGSSLYLDGSSHLSIPYSADFDFAGDFTIEAWVRPDAGYNTNVSSPRPFVAGGGFPSGYAAYLYAGSTVPGSLDFAANTGSWGGASLAASPPAEQWYHVAFVRSAGVMTLYINGLAMGSSSAFTGSITSASSSLTIGTDNTYYFTGYIDDLRITPMAVYTDSFSPPTGPLAACATAVVPLEEQASLMLHLDGADQDTFTTDSSIHNHPVAFVGGAEIDTAQSQFGGSSCLFVPSSSRLDIDDHSALDLGGAFTVEMWVRTTSHNGNWCTLAKNGNDDWANGYGFECSGTDTVAVIGTGSSLATITGASLAVDQWQHLALTRNTNGDCQLFIDGIEQGVSVNTTADLSNAYALLIGNREITGQGGYVRQADARIDEVRIVKLAVYSGDFSVPTSALSTTVKPYTSFLTYGTLISSECVDGDLVGTYADGYGGRYTETISAGSC